MHHDRESHNQLHNYLIPLKDDLTKLKTSKTNIAILKEMHKYLLTFKNISNEPQSHISG